MEEYSEKFKTAIIDIAPSVLTALAMLIVGLFIIRFIIKITNCQSAKL